MKYIIKNKVFQGAFLCAAVLFGATACTDDHFDVKTGGVESNTIWENISSQSELSDFADILKKTIVMKDDNDTRTTLTYDNLLLQPQSFTVWAPKNGTYNAQTYKDQLDQALELLSSNDPTEVSEGRAIMYRVSSQFVGSHIARYNYESDKANQKVTMLNSKRYYYNAGANEFNSVATDPTTADLHSSNGTVHLLNGLSAFNYNLYDYMENDTRFSKMFEFYTSPEIQTETFSESGSTEGTLNDNGDMVYADSVFVVDNDIYNTLNASIQNEDSLYLATYYTDQAWEEAIAAFEPYFQYGSVYEYDWSNTTNTFGPDTSFTDAVKDSLRLYNTKYLLESSMYFNPNRFGLNTTDSAMIINHALTADSLISTNRTIYYNKEKGNTNPMYGSNVEPLKASNGYIFALDHFNADVAYAWQSKEEVYSYIDFLRSNGDGMASNSTITLDESNRNPAIPGSFKNDMFMRFNREGTNLMRLWFRMPQLMSGHYKVSIVTAPSTIMSVYADNENYQNENISFVARLFEDNGDTQLCGANNNARVTASNEKVDTVVLWNDYEVKKCYYGLPESIESFPILDIMVQANNTNLRALNIGAIIVEPYRPENE